MLDLAGSGGAESLEGSAARELDSVVEKVVMDLEPTEFSRTPNGEALESADVLL